MTETFAIIAGGGTAGHVVPGLAIANELVSRGVDIDAIHYVGSERGIETRLVPDAGFALTVLPGRGIQRRITAENLRSLWGLVRAVWQGIKLVRRLRPSVVVGLGGYASVPCVVGAVVGRVPIVVAEQNAVPGAANRLAGRFAKACAVSFAGTALPRATWTGNPVRREVLDAVKVDRADARSRLGVPLDRTMIAIFGGSLGARRINYAVRDALPHWVERPDLAVRHVAGTRDYDELTVSCALPANPVLNYELIEYENDMATVYAAADLIVCRAGASSVAELAVMGAPAILVPLPGAPGDHQTANGRALEAAGAAVVVVDSDLDGETLVATVDELLGDPDRLGEMARGGATVARPDAAAAVVDLIEQHRRTPISNGATR